MNNIINSTGPAQRPARTIHQEPAPTIYLDYAATSPIDPRVLEKMLPFLSNEGYGYANPASSHAYGKKVAEAIEEARSQVAKLLNVNPATILWTSGATESNNLSLKGVAHFYQRFGKHIITCQTEHPSILDTAAQLSREGFEITYLKPNSQGLIELQHLQAALRPDTILVSIMHVNNETGIIQDIGAIGSLTREREIFLHVDATQSVGKIPIDLQTLPVDLMSFSAHKIYGPKGIGGLYLNDNPRVRLIPQMHGGGQERALRAGTLATHQIVGMGKAFELANAEMDKESRQMLHFRDKLWTGICNLPGVHLNGHPEHRAPGILNVRFETLEKEKVLQHLTRLAFSSASACVSTTTETSHVLRAMGLKNELAHRSFRFSFGRFTTDEDIDTAIDLLTSSPT